MGELIQKKKFPFSHNYLFSIYNIGKGSLTDIKNLHIIMPMERKMNKSCVGTHRDQLSLLQHLAAVNSKILS